MNGWVALLCGLLGMVSSAAGMFVIAQLWVDWFRISSFEGKSGYFIIGQTLLGGIVGLIAAVVASLTVQVYLGWEWYLQLLGVLSVIAMLLSLVLAISYRQLDQIPLWEGRPIQCCWEIRLPASQDDRFAEVGNPDQWPDDELKLQLVSIVNDRPRAACLATFDRAAFRQEHGQWILVARVPLFTSKGQFCVNLTLGGRDDGFWPAMSPQPIAVLFQWSSWNRTNKGRERSSDQQATMYRFRYETVKGEEPGND